MALTQKICAYNDCGREFTSVKSKYCCTECRKAGALSNRILTNLEKYGVENPYQSTDIKEKIRITNLEKYGVENPMQSKKINDKAHLTIYKKYGVNHALQSAALLDKMQNSMIERHGAPTSLQSDSIREIIYSTNRVRYGNEQYSISHISSKNYDLLNNKDWLIEQNTIKSIQEIRSILGVGQSVVNQKFREFGIRPTQFNSSKFELSVQNFLADNDIEYITHDRQILNGKELDIFIPSFNLAIECNGTYWHSELNGKGKQYHINKTYNCTKSGIDLFHLWEHEWDNNRDIISSMLLSRLGLSKKLYARKCKIKLVTVHESREFLNTNHLQGWCPNSVCIGLYHIDKLVSIMSFGKNRFRKGAELLRFCNINNTSVVGAASKLFSYYVCMYNPAYIISYSHKDKFTGGLYKKLGFFLSHTATPAYYYTTDYNIIENRMKYQKHKLSKLLPVFDNNLTEWQNMQNNGYDRIWDCGNDVWKYKMETF